MLSLRNTGQQTAKGVTSNQQWEYFRGDSLIRAQQGILPSIPKLEDFSKRDVEATAPFSIVTTKEKWKSEVEKNLVMKSDGAFFVWGEVSYTRPDGQRCRKQFCGFVEDKHTVFIKSCRFHNETICS